MEKWKPIKGYEGLYEVSSYGRIKGLPREYQTPQKTVCHRKEYIRKPYLTKKGYFRCGFTDYYGTTKFVFVHRIVAVNFLDNKNNYSLQINHKNGIKHDNRVENLEWCSAQENMKHSVKKGFKVANPHYIEEIRELKKRILKLEESLALYKNRI